jgi:hypothetical protein
VVSKLKNTLLSIRRFQRHLKLAFIIADEETSNVIERIINWCSFDVLGAGSLIYTLNSLENRFSQSLFKEHDPDVLIKVGEIPESALKKLERKYQPFETWDWNEIKDHQNSVTSLPNMLNYIRKQSNTFPIYECRVASKSEDDKLFLLSATLFGFLLPNQRESLKDYLKFLDVKISKDNPVEMMNYQRYSGVINLSRDFFWPDSEWFDSSWCYDIFERETKAFHDCLVIDDIENWENFSLFWNLKAHFRRRILFLPTFLFDDKSEVLRNFLWDKLQHDHNLTILSSSLDTSEMAQLLNSIPNSKLKKKNSMYSLELERRKETKSIKVKIGSDDWTEIFGKIKVTFGKVDSIPVYFPDTGGMIEAPEPTLFGLRTRHLYAVDFRIPFFKPPKSENLRYGLGTGGRTRISTIGLTTMQGGLSPFPYDKFVPVRALDPMRMVNFIVSDHGFTACASSNGEMANRFLSLLRNPYELYILSGEDVVSFVKQSNPLIRNEEGKTVKKPDEEAAIDWGTVQRFLNIRDEPYLTRKFAERIVSWMVSHGLLKLGTKIKCKNCFNKQWIPIDQIKQDIECSACFSELPKPLGDFHHLQWNYLPNVLLGRAIDQGFLTSLLAIHYLTYENRESEEKMTLFYPGIDILKDDSQVAELDLFIVSEGEIITGECKIGHDVTEEEVDKLISISEDIGADVVLFCTLASFSRECVDLINKKANQSKLKVAVLQSDQLLNQTLFRRLKKQRSQRKGSEKSYRQIFVEDIVRRKSR